MITVGGRPVGIVTALAFHWACLRARSNVRRVVAEFAIGFSVGVALGVAGCAALVG